MAASRSRFLGNLAGELEYRMTGVEAGLRLTEDLAASIPDSPTYVLVLFDGLGMAQLRHPAAAPLRKALKGVLHSPFPTTTSVALSSLATASDAVDHGVLSHLMWMPELGRVVNTLKWVDLSGSPVVTDYSSVLPRPNLWERLRQAGIEAITVQPASFQGSPLSRLLYRGARFEPAFDDLDAVRATVQLAEAEERLIFAYVWQVDFAGHVHGLGSAEFGEAVRHAAGMWEQLSARLPSQAVLVGTADHGLIEYDESDKILVRAARFESLRFAGDPRGIQVWGDPELVTDFIRVGGGSVASPEELYGRSPTRDVGDRIILAPRGKVILPRGFDKRLRAYHGGLEPAEVEVPLLIG